MHPILHRMASENRNPLPPSEWPATEVLQVAAMPGKTLTACICRTPPRHDPAGFPEPIYNMLYFRNAMNNMR